MIEKLLKGNRRALAKCITLCESRKIEHQVAGMTILEQVMSHTGKSIRIGISGPPGVGKSSFIENIGQIATKKGHKLAVLAVDPSSPISKGSILGDKTRMSKLAIDQNAFIRPSPTKGHLGGTSSSTLESILLCEAAGFDIIIVETVGVGQSEVAVSEMVDLFIMLQLPHAGDELQGIKKGILEMADIVGITKYDGEFKEKARQTKSQHINAFRYLSREKESPHVQLLSNETQEGIPEFWKRIKEIMAHREETGFLQIKRKAQRRIWLKRELELSFSKMMNESKDVETILHSYESQVEENQIPASLAAYRIMKTFHDSHLSI